MKRQGSWASGYPRLLALTNKYGIVAKILAFAVEDGLDDYFDELVANDLAALDGVLLTQAKLDLVFDGAVQEADRLGLTAKLENRRSF